MAGRAGGHTTERRYIEIGLRNEHEVAVYLNISVASVRRWRTLRTGSKFGKPRRSWNRMFGFRSKSLRELRCVN